MIEKVVIFLLNLISYLAFYVIYGSMVFPYKILPFEPEEKKAFNDYLEYLKSFNYNVDNKSYHVEAISCEAKHEYIHYQYEKMNSNIGSVYFSAVILNIVFAIPSMVICYVAFKSLWVLGLHIVICMISLFILYKPCQDHQGLKNRKEVFESYAERVIKGTACNKLDDKGKLMVLIDVYKHDLNYKEKYIYDMVKLRNDNYSNAAGIMIAMFVLALYICTH